MQTGIWGCAGPQCCCIASCVFDGIVWTFRLWRLCKFDMDGMGSCVGLSHVWGFLCRLSKEESANARGQGLAKLQISRDPYR